MEIYLVRHPRVAVAPGICYGGSDVALASDYLSDIEALKMKSIPWKTLDVISSPLARCALAARALSPSPVERRDELKELDFGDWELRAWNEIDASELARWTENFVSTRCPNGESYLDLHARVSRFWNELAERTTDKVAIVTHAGVIRCILAIVLEIRLENSFTLKVEYGGVTKIVRKAGLVTVEYVNR